MLFVRMSAASRAARRGERASWAARTWAQASAGPSGDAAVVVHGGEVALGAGHVEVGVEDLLRESARRGMVLMRRFSGA